MMTIKTTAGSESTGRECKIFKSGDIFFALAGFYRDPARGFDLRRLVVETIRKDMTLSEATDAVANAVSSSLHDELLKLRSESPELFNKYVGGRPGQLAKILFTCFEDGVPKVAFLGFSEEGLPSGEITVSAKRAACPGDCNSQSVSAFYMTDRTAIDEYLKNGGKLDWLSPEKAAKQLVELVIKAGTPGVGPPVDVLRIDGNGAEWVARKPECPDYDDAETDSPDNRQKD
jgi:hypothetical protein